MLLIDKRCFVVIAAKCQCPYPLVEGPDGNCTMPEDCPCFDRFGNVWPVDRIDIDEENCVRM